MERIEAKGKTKKQDEIIKEFKKKCIDLNMNHSEALIVMMSRFNKGMEK
jgi:hypothetical protein